MSARGRAHLRRWILRWVYDYSAQRAR